MKKSTHSDEYDFVLKKLIAMRTEAGFTQQQLADALKREQSFIWQIEPGERRLDVVEFFWVCEALNQDAQAIYDELVAAFRHINKPSTDGWNQHAANFAISSLFLRSVQKYFRYRSYPIVETLSDCAGRHWKSWRADGANGLQRRPF